MENEIPKFDTSDDMLVGSRMLFDTATQTHKHLIPTLDNLVVEGATIGDVVTQIDVLIVQHVTTP